MSEAIKTGAGAACNLSPQTLSLDGKQARFGTAAQD